MGHDSRGTLATTCERNGGLFWDKQENWKVGGRKRWDWWQWRRAEKGCASRAASHAVVSAKMLLGDCSGFERNERREWVRMLWSLVLSYTTVSGKRRWKLRVPIFNLATVSRMDKRERKPPYWWKLQLSRASVNEGLAWTEESQAEWRCCRKSTHAFVNCSVVDSVEGTTEISQTAENILYIQHTARVHWDSTDTRTKTQVKDRPLNQELQPDLSSCVPPRW